MDQDAFRKLVHDRTENGVTGPTPTSTNPSVSSRPTFFRRPGASRTQPLSQPKKDVSRHDDQAGGSFHGHGKPMYRDRAKERREGIVTDDFANPQTILDLLCSTSIEVPNEHEKSEQAVDDIHTDGEPLVGGSTPSNQYPFSGMVTKDSSGKGLDLSMLRKSREESKIQAAAEKSAKEAQDYVDSMYGATGPVACLNPVNQPIYDLGMRVGNHPRHDVKTSSSFMAGLRSCGILDLMLESMATRVTPESRMIVEKLIGLFEFLKSDDSMSGDVVERPNLAASTDDSSAQPKKRIRKDLDVGRMSDSDSDSDSEERGMNQPVESSEKSKAAFTDKGDGSGSDIFSDAGSDYAPVINPKRKRVTSDTDSSSAAQPAVTLAPAPYFLIPADEDSDNEHGTVGSCALNPNLSGGAPSLSLSIIIKQNAEMLNALQGSGTAEKLVNVLSSAHAHSDLHSNPPVAPAGDPADSAALANPHRLVGFSALDAPDGTGTTHTYLDTFHSDGDSSASDDEPDYTQIDHGAHGNKKRQLGKFDFDTIEEWQSYKETQVHMPKAAFLFGVKAGERKSKLGAKGDGSDLGKSHGGNKMDRDYLMLDKVYRKKFGSGLDEDGSNVNGGGSNGGGSNGGGSSIDDRNRHSYASIGIGLIYEVDRHYSEVLANLPELYFKQIIDILVFNGKDIARRMTPPDRLNYAAHVLECMKKHNVLPSFNLLKTAIYIYGHLRDLNSVDRVYAYIIQKGFDLHDPRLLTNMCRAYILNGQDEKGIAYFKRQHIRYHTQSAYNSLIGVYVDLNDHPGVFSALNLMQNAKIPANADTIAMICKLYLAQNDLDTVCKHIEMFKSKGGVLESNMYHIQIRVCNARGEHQAVLDNIREMKASNVEISRKTLRYVITAYAHLGDVQRMLSVYRISAPTSSSSIESHTAMAMAFGPLLSSDAVSDIKIRAVYSSVSPITLLYDLVRGYQQLGDVVSVKLLLDDLEKAESRFSPSWYNFVILAYHVAKDADGAWSYAQVLADKYQNNVSPGVWRSVIRTVSLYKPQMLDGVVAYIKSRYKEFPIEDALASV
ncbi:hypothetical protein BSLG_004088 [Batrachochytrium salamandrivorans]|nr:hypothetical protein BSLG_004088 [Batrachochytrium salamandrivorans]